MGNDSQNPSPTQPLDLSAGMVPATPQQSAPPTGSAPQSPTISGAPLDLSAGMTPNPPQESDLHKAFLGPNTMLGAETPPSLVKAGQGVSDVLHGNIRQGLSEIWGEGHIIQGSPLEKIIQTFKPDFKGSSTPEQADTAIAKEQAPITSAPVDFAQFIDKKKNPMGKAVAETAQSFLSPAAISTLIATGGAGMIENPGALGLANRLVSIGFAVSSIANAYKHLKGFKEAYDAGNTAEAEYQLTHAVISGSLSALMAQHATTGKGPAENAWTKAGAKADAAVGNAVKTVAGLPSKAADLIPNRDASIPPADHVEQAAENLYKTIKPGKSQVADDFKETLNNSMDQLRAVANKYPEARSPIEAADAIDKLINDRDAQLKQKAFDMRGHPDASMTDLQDNVQKAMREGWNKAQGKFTPDEIEKAEATVMKQLGIESKMEKDPDTGVTAPTPYRTGPIPDLFTADNIRRRFNDDTRGSFDRGNVPPAEVYAKQVANGAIRDDIDQKYEDLGVDGAKEWRKAETGLIDVRDGLRGSAKRAEDAGQWNALDSIFKRKGWGGVPAVAGAFYLGGGPGVIAGELAHMGMDWWRDQQTNPNVLTSKAWEHLQKAGLSPDAATLKQVTPKSKLPELDDATEEHVEDQAEKKMLAHGEEEKGPKLPEDKLREHYKNEVRDDMGLPTTDDLEKEGAKSGEAKTEAKPKITYDTDSLGIKWATQEGSPAKVSVPKNLEGAEADRYAQEKLGEQKAFVKSRETKEPETKVEEPVVEPKLEEKVEPVAQPEEPKPSSDNSAAFGAAAGINALSGRKEEEPKTVAQHRWGPVTWAAHEKTPVDIGETLDRASKEFNVPSILTRAQAHQESKFDTDAISNKGARGIMQLMPKTSEALGVTDPHDPEQNIFGGVRYMSQLHQKFGTWDKALAAYNAGPTTVQKLIQEHGENWFDYLPAETRRYVHKILIESVR